MDLDQLEEEGNRLNAAANEKLAEFVAAVKKVDTAGVDPSARRKLQDLAAEMEAIQTELKGVITQLQEALGISEDELVAIEQAQLPTSDDRWWLHQILETPPSEYLDTFCQKAVDALLRRVDQEWLKREAAHPYRLDNGFITSPLHLAPSALRSHATSCTRSSGKARRPRLLCRSVIRSGTGSSREATGLHSTTWS
jgi:hypothetical protein